MNTALPIFSLLCWFFCTPVLFGQSPKVGAFYFDGWTQFQWNNYEKLNYQKGAYNEVLVHEFSDREPAYGWITSTAEGIRQQIEDGLEAGLDFFVFDWYYCKDTGYEGCFMNNALSLFMENPQSDLKFASMITNDTHDIGPKEWEETMAQLKKQFQHPAYFTIDGRPVVYIYRGDHMTKAFGSVRKFNRALDQLKRECIESGLGEPLIGLARIIGKYAPRRYKWADFMFTYNQPLLLLEDKIEPIRDNEYDIEDMISGEFDYWFYLERKSQNKYFVPTITSGWDRRPWDKSTRIFYTRATREYMAEAVSAAMEFNEDYNEKSLDNMILIYAWNEYAEGGYLSRMKNGEFIGLGIKDAKEKGKEQ